MPPTTADHGSAPARRAREALTVSSDRFYAVQDWRAARKFGLALWILGLVVTMPLLAFAPPVAEVPAAVGWSISALLLAIGAVVVLRLVRARDEPRRTEMLVGSTYGVVAVGVFGWLGASDIFGQVLLLPAVFSAVVHPPRRAIVVIMAAVGAALVPLILTDSDNATAGDAASTILLLLALSFIAMGWTARVHRERREAARANAVERERARIDQLTDLPNRRGFDEALVIEMARHTRSKSPLLLVLLDLEDFKRINDVYGHLEGDRVLREVAETLAAASRPPDQWFRWGGDEFAALYPSTSAADAPAIRTRLLGEIERRCIRPDGSGVRAQMGTAVWAPGITPEQLLGAADDEVMEQKQRLRMARYGSGPADAF